MESAKSFWNDNKYAILFAISIVIVFSLIVYIQYKNRKIVDDSVKKLENDIKIMEDDNKKISDESEKNKVIVDQFKEKNTKMVGSYNTLAQKYKELKNQINMRYNKYFPQNVADINDNDVNRENIRQPKVTSQRLEADAFPGDQEPENNDQHYSDIILDEDIYVDSVNTSENREINENINEVGAEDVNEVEVGVEDVNEVEVEAEDVNEVEVEEKYEDITKKMNDQEDNNEINNEINEEYDSDSEYEFDLNDIKKNNQ